MPAAPRAMPRFPKPSPELVALFEEALPDEPLIVRKQVFGNPSAVVNGTMFAGLRGTRLLLRLPPVEMERLLLLPGAERFEPLPGMTMQNFALLPESLLADTDAVRDWLARAFAGALALPEKKAKARKASSRR